MWRALLLLVSVLITAVSAAAVAEPRNPDAIALIIGNKTYRHPDVPEVKFADRDAEAIKRYVIDVLGYDEGNVFVLANATQGELLSWFGGEGEPQGELADDLRPGNRSDVFVYYSGHGMPSLDGREGYLLPSDGNPNTIGLTGYKLSTLYANLRQIGARSVTVVVDACFSGQSAGGTLVPGASVMSRPAAVASGLTVLAATKSDLVANWDTAEQHGLFTAFFLRGVYGAADDPKYGGHHDGRITLGAVKQYLDEEMSYYARRNFHRQQHADVEGDPGLVLATIDLAAPPARPGSGPVAPPPASPAVATTTSSGYPVAVRQSFHDCPDGCPEMVVIPAGSFMMGSPAGEKDREADEAPQHEVTISRPLAVGKTAVTFAQWDACVSGGGCGGYRPSDQHWGRDDRPVINVSWNDAQSYVQWLSRKTGKGYRLLSEAEWEYAARGGMTTAYWWGDAIGQGNANCDGCGSQGSSRQTAPVGSFRPNPFALQDMLGNVWQWAEDCYHNTYEGAPSDGSAWASSSCNDYVLRGGSWYDSPKFLRSAYRFDVGPSLRSDIVGFRVARTPGP